MHEGRERKTLDFVQLKERQQFSIAFWVFLIEVESLGAQKRGVTQSNIQASTNDKHCIVMLRKKNVPKPSK